MFLAHFANWSYSEIMNMTTEEIHNWHKEALELHNYLNQAQDG